MRRVLDNYPSFRDDNITMSRCCYHHLLSPAPTQANSINADSEMYLQEPDEFENNFSGSRCLLRRYFNVASLEDLGIATCRLVNL